VCVSLCESMITLLFILTSTVSASASASSYFPAPIHPLSSPFSQHHTKAPADDILYVLRVTPDNDTLVSRLIKLSLSMNLVFLHFCLCSNLHFMIGKSWCKEPLYCF